jgi:hypothetical protein
MFLSKIPEGKFATLYKAAVREVQAVGLSEDNQYDDK